MSLLYVSPERFNNERFVSALKGVKVALFVVDEAHCISEVSDDDVFFNRFECSDQRLTDRPTDQPLDRLPTARPIIYAAVPSVMQ